MGDVWFHDDLHQFVRATFTSLAPRAIDAGAHAVLEFDSGTVVPLLGEKPAAISEGEFSLSACTDPVILIDGKEPDGQVKGRPVDLHLAGGQLLVDRLTLDKSAMRVESRGTARSVTQHGRELVPTVLEDMLNASPANRGMLGLVAAFLILAAISLVNRALTVLYEKFIPKIPDGGDK